jgi:hypothetical protein
MCPFLLTQTLRQSHTEWQNRIGDDTEQASSQKIQPAKSFVLKEEGLVLAVPVRVAASFFAHSPPADGHCVPQIAVQKMQAAVGGLPELV